MVSQCTKSKYTQSPLSFSKYSFFSVSTGTLTLNYTSLANIALFMKNINIIIVLLLQDFSVAEKTQSTLLHLSAN